MSSFAPAALLALVITVIGCAPERVNPPNVLTTSAIARSLDPFAPRPPADAFEATVERVVDGDTVVARRAPGNVKVRVRIIGLDAPETVKPNTPTQCYGPEASAYLHAVLTGKPIRAAYEAGGRQDKFGRDLWDVWLADGTFVAGRMVDEGLARALRIRPQVEHATYLAARQSAAAAARRGLWRACSQ